MAKRPWTKKKDLWKVLKNIFNKQKKKLPRTRSHVLSGQYHSKADDPSISKDIDIHPLHLKLWETWFSEVGQCNFTAAIKKHYSLFLENYKDIGMKMANHHDKQHTQSESWYQTVTFNMSCITCHLRLKCLVPTDLTFSIYLSFN